MFFKKSLSYFAVNLCLNKYLCSNYQANDESVNLID